MIWKLAPAPTRAFPLFYQIDARVQPHDICIHVPQTMVAIHAPLSAFASDAHLTPDDEYLQWHASVLRVSLRLKRPALARRHIDYVLRANNRQFGQVLVMLSKMCGRHSDIVHAYGVLVHMTPLFSPTDAFRQELRRLLLDNTSPEVSDVSQFALQTNGYAQRLFENASELALEERRVSESITPDMTDESVEKLLVTLSCVPSLRYWKRIDPCAEFAAVVREWARGPFLQGEWVPADASSDEEAKLDVDHTSFRALWLNGQCPPGYCLERWARNTVKFSTHSYIDLTGYEVEPIRSLTDMRKATKGRVEFRCTKPIHMRACLLLCIVYPRHVRRVGAYTFVFELDDTRLNATISCARRPDVDLITFQRVGGKRKLDMASH